MIGTAVSFVRYSIRAVLVGSSDYYKWVALLIAIICAGLFAFAHQLNHGLIVTAMTDQVSWGAYIANFTFCVGLAAAAVMLVIPAYVYKNKAIKEVVFVGEALAIAAVVVCLLFVNVDLGRPDRFWHLFPIVGEFNFPISVLSWDTIVLFGYLLINVGVVTYLLFRRYVGKKPNEKFYVPVMFLSMFWAVSLHTVTAFLYVALGGRPFWNTAILAPRFLASAFVAGPALIIITLRVIHSKTVFNVQNKAFSTLRGILTVTVLINLFLFASEVFTEFYPQSLHAAPAQYLFFGLHGHAKLVPYIWTAVALNCTSALILITPSLARRPWLVNIVCVMSIIGVWIEKGMGLIIPGFVPTSLGEIVEYSPSLVEFAVSMGVWSIGALIFTAILKIAIPIYAAEVTDEPVAPPAAEPSSAVSR